MLKKILSGVIIFSLISSSALHAQSVQGIHQLIVSLDSVREKLKIPGMAAALMRGDSIAFATGFGYADMKNHVKATKSTTFRIASITKTFTSSLIMQLVEQGKLDLDAPVSKYGLDFGNPKITVRNLLTHTSEGDPGTHFQYNGYRYGQLGPIIEQAAGSPFYALLMERIIQPLGMSHTAPGISLANYFSYIQHRKDMIPFFENAFKNLAKPYALDGNGHVVETNYFDEFGAFGGLASCVTDLLKYSSAIDKHRFVKTQTQELIFTPIKTRDGVATPYGLGWFSQNYKGVDFYWHYGQTQGESGIFIKVPSRKLTFVVLANSDMLSKPFPVGDGDIFTSPIGQLLYKYVINNDKSLQIIDFDKPVASFQSVVINSTANKDFYSKEIITQATISNISSDTDKASQLYRLYSDMNFTSAPTITNEPVLVALEHASINKDLTENFSISVATKIRVYGVGENCSADFSSWCDYGWIEDSAGKIIWTMQGQSATSAGGAIKNQKVDTVITLPPGQYKLRYKSDWAHAYNNWDSAPPDHFFWGIILFKI